MITEAEALAKASATGRHGYCPDDDDRPVFEELAQRGELKRFQENHLPIFGLTMPTGKSIGLPHPEMQNRYPQRDAVAQFEYPRQSHRKARP